MAIDTAAKRASTIMVASEEFGMHLPSAGGVNTAGERAAVAYAYSGLAAEAPVIEVYRPGRDRRRRAASMLWG